MQLRFEWDPNKAATNLRKHGVSFSEAAEVFKDPLALTLFDKVNSAHEDRWITLGQVGVRRLVVVVHTWQEQDADAIYVRIISAREATTYEAKQYKG